MASLPLGYHGEHGELKYSSFLKGPLTLGMALAIPSCSTPLVRENDGSFATKEP